MPLPRPLRRWVSTLLLLPLLALPAWGDPAAAQPTVLIVTGAPGQPQYGATFAEAATRWEEAATKGHARVLRLGETTQPVTPREALQQALTKEATGTGELWLVLIGHGTFDGKEPRFALRESDFTAAELAQWLAPIKRPLAVVATFSSSGAFLKPLSARGRVVLTSTRAGAEDNYSRLGEYLAQTIAAPAADLDQDGQTSLLEAWITAAQQVTAFYQGDGRLATEHSLLDDNGDGLGTPADWFKGTRAVKKSQGSAPVDGPRAHQFHLVPNAAEQSLPPAVKAERDRLELELSALRDRKATLAAEEYYRLLERLLLQLAQVYAAPAPEALAP